MLPHRRYLPSIPALLAFEAVARLGSATAAAAELAQTQSAVSRQLKSLETQIGARLLRRAGRQLVLTPAGRAYAAKVREVLGQLGAASLAAATGPEGGALTLAILPAFGMHWLAPRLPGFAAAHPQVTVNLSTRLAPFDFRTEPFDAAIHFGRCDWPGVDYLELIPETVVAVCAPQLAPAPLPLTELARLPLLHLDTRPRGWARFLAANGAQTDPPPGPTFDQFSTMAQAAIHGLGVALLPVFVAAPHLQDGSLVRATEATGASIGTYYLVWPSGQEPQGPLAVFRDWLAREAAATPHS